MPGLMLKKAPDTIEKMAVEVLCKYDNYQLLLDAKVRIGYLVAYAPTDDAGAPKGPAIKVHGQAAWACVTVNPLPQRALGGPDAVITIDAAWWTKEDRTDEQRMALLDHELYHLELTLDGEAAVLDTCKRPKLSLKQHDVQFGWFREVALRNGKDSAECMQAEELLKGDAQTFWPQLLKEAAAARGARYAAQPA